MLVSIRIGKNFSQGCLAVPNLQFFNIVQNAFDPATTTKTAYKKVFFSIQQDSSWKVRAVALKGSENIWFSWSKPSNYPEKLRCNARDIRTDGKWKVMQCSGRPETANSITSISYVIFVIFFTQTKVWENENLHRKTPIFANLHRNLHRKTPFFANFLC